MRCSARGAFATKSLAVEEPPARVKGTAPSKDTRAGAECANPGSSYTSQRCSYGSFKRACRLAQAEWKGESISTESLIGALTGPVGAIVVLAIAVFSLATTRYVVPAPVFKASEERNFLLAAENESLQQISLKQNDQLTEQKVHNARLQEQVNYLTQRIETLTAEIEGLRKQVQDSL